MAQPKDSDPAQRTGSLGLESNIKDLNPVFACRRKQDIAMHFLVDEDLPRTGTASFILDLLENFLQQEDLVARLPGSLVIVQPGQVRIRTAYPDPKNG